MANFVSSYYIQELPEEAKEAATKLGYTKKMWDSDKGMYIWIGHCYMHICLSLTLTLTHLVNTSYASTFYFHTLPFILSSALQITEPKCCDE